MADSNKGASLFNECEGFLTELSTTDEAVLTGGTHFKFKFKGGSSSGSGKRGSSSSGRFFGKGGSSSSGGFRGFSKKKYGYFFYHH